MATSRSRRRLMAFGGAAVVLLAAAVFTLGSLRVPWHPANSGFVPLFALSTFIFAAFLIFGLIMVRNLVRLWTERRAGQLGSRFKTQMVAGAMSISLLPIVFLFFFSYALVNRTLNLWFPRPLELSADEAQSLLAEWESTEYARLLAMAQEAATRKMNLPAAVDAFRGDADEIWLVDSSGAPTAAEDLTWRAKQQPALHSAGKLPPPAPNLHFLRGKSDKEEFWGMDDQLLLAARAPLGDQSGGLSILFGRRLTPDFLRRMDAMKQQGAIYARQREQIRVYKKQILLALLLITILLLSTTTWVALFLAKIVTVPIQALAEGTQEIAQGNFNYRVSVQAQDELGALVASFNQMTAQLGDSRRQIDEFTRSLQQAVEEREQRRQLMEAILENIPTGVLSLTPAGEISRINAAAVAILGKSAASARNIADLAGGEAGREIHHLMRRALRLGIASREMELPSAGRSAHAAVTVSALGTRRNNPGYLLVIDDLTELLQAQKAAAWQEVARRIAHEIKNPLTPIQLSAQRMLRYLDRSPGLAGANGTRRICRLVAECSRLIEREAGALASLVNEFSQFVRFPSARLEPADANAIVSDAVQVFHGRMEGITLRLDLSPSLPLIRGDSELLRRVIVNLIDNAAEAMEGSAVRAIVVTTRLHSARETVEISVADTGQGISPEDKDRLFLPFLHQRTAAPAWAWPSPAALSPSITALIRAEDNRPVGRALVSNCLPVAETGRAGAEITAVRITITHESLHPDRRRRSGIRQSLSSHPAEEGYEVGIGGHRRGLPRAPCRRGTCDLVLLDIWLPKHGWPGNPASACAGTEHPPMVVMISGHGNIETAVRATKIGRLRFHRKAALHRRRRVARRSEKRWNFSAWKRKTAACARNSARYTSSAKRSHEGAAPADRPRRAHQRPRADLRRKRHRKRAGRARAASPASLRSREPFVEVNCAAIPEELIESELFGHLKGSFTGASEDKVGKFQQADDGTLFLDEVGDMSLRTQAKVLRVLEEQRLEPVGSQSADRRERPRDRRDQQETGGANRERRFPRGPVLPPQRDSLHRAAAARARGRYPHAGPPFPGGIRRRLRPQAQGAERRRRSDVLTRYHWPGNVRELRNLIERLVIICPQARIEPQHLPPEIFRGVPAAACRIRTPRSGSPHRLRTRVHPAQARGKPVEHDANGGRLGLERSHLYRKMKSLGIAGTRGNGG